MHTHTHTRMHTRTPPCTQACTHACMHTHTNTRMHTHSHTHAHTLTHTRMHTHTHTHAHTHTHTHTHTHGCGQYHSKQRPSCYPGVAWASLAACQRGSVYTSAGHCSLPAPPGQTWQPFAPHHPGPLERSAASAPHGGPGTTWLWEHRTKHTRVLRQHDWENREQST